ncbi:retinol dehydrogenase 5 [Narcine bancroftii]|uniref:retinol dehydrogenase 5 n=1 Tax=Narcine bancroftii TaxID=1343680 RepID=UPI003831D340
MWLYLLTAVLLLAVRWFIRDRQKIQDIKDKFVLITGCDSGFGNLLAKNLDRQGFRVLACCLTQKGVDTVQRNSSSRLKAFLLDVTDHISIQKLADWVQVEVKEKGLWGLVNNAGIATPVAPTDWLKIEDYQKVLNVNLLGLVEVTLTFLPLIKKARGRIVNVSSIFGRISFAGGGYCLSKHGVESFSDTLRHDLRYFDIQVSIIEPGFFKTAATNSELIVNEQQRLWDSLSLEVRKSYGENYFENYVKNERKVLNKFCDSDISKVTNCMEHALTARHPQTRYTAGWDAKLFWIPISYMPTVFVDFLISFFLLKPSNRVQ